MRKFSIGGEVEFEPGRRVMRGGGKELKIQSSSVYCLELLIENQGKVIEHEAFYDFAWRRFGMEVSPNALYQSISMLRKALLACGNSEDFIRTVPRRGFMLSGKVEITCTELQNEPSSTEGENDPAPRQAEPEGNENVTILPEELPLPTEENHVSEASTGTYSQPERIRLKINNALFWIAYGVAFAAIVLTPCLYFITYSVDYVKRFDFNGCAFYSNNMADDDITMQAVIKKKIRCDERKYVYITLFPGGSRMSVIQCEKEIGPFLRPNCISYYYIGNPL
ncbi:transcriptional regulator [Erwinia sp. ErVv1]|uniref:transcriptional regulator n=1 Tax=Erwinia sp. ErVv1 TaxID=1603299 RepID=UPI00082F4394|nr:winged helix-turn-helix domain-containing protein [Erwinia sp. ErVv1]